MGKTLSEIAEFLGGELVGDGSVVIEGVAEIDKANAHQLSFAAAPKYFKFLETTRAAAVIVPETVPQAGRPIIRVKDPFFAFMQVVRMFHPPTDVLKPGIHATAIVGEDTHLDGNVAIGAYVVIGQRCHLGANVKILAGTVIGDEVFIDAYSVIHPNVTIWDRVRIGKNVVIHAGSVIGSEGFGFYKKEGAYHRVPQVGTVIIEDDVEIGANCTIDRATLGATRIRRGTKLDNLIHVAHNVEIGEDTVIAAQVGISGSTRIGSGVTIGGQAGFVDHIEIGDHVAVGAQAGITKSIPPNTVVSGYPAKPHSQAKREEAALRRLPNLIKRVKILEQKIKELETATKD